MAGSGNKKQEGVGRLGGHCDSLCHRGLWPIALVVLFVKLFGSDEQKAARPRRPWRRPAPEQPAESAQAGQASRLARRPCSPRR